MYPMADRGILPFSLHVHVATTCIHHNFWCANAFVLVLELLVHGSLHARLSMIISSLSLLLLSISHVSSQFLMPGLVDAHNHAPQYRYTGTGYDMSIQERLRTYKIPTEARFADVEMARKTYPYAVVRYASKWSNIFKGIIWFYCQAINLACVQFNASPIGMGYSLGCLL